MDGAGLGEWLVQATHDFPGNESGELPLEKGDVVKVARQLAGQYHQPEVPIVPLYTFVMYSLTFPYKKPL